MATNQHILVEEAGRIILYVPANVPVDPKGKQKCVRTFPLDRECSEVPEELGTSLDEIKKNHPGAIGIHQFDDIDGYLDYMVDKYGEKKEG